MFLANLILIFIQKLNFSDKIYVRVNVEKCIICEGEVTYIYLSSYSTLTYLIIVNILQSMKLELEYNVSVDIWHDIFYYGVVLLGNDCKSKLPGSWL